MNRHGEGGLQTRTVEYTAWAAMIQRCYNPKRFNYERYGGIGVTVCQRWRDSFLAFLTDVGRKPSKQHTLDRFPDRQGNYEPGNVRWATPKEQARNTRRNVMLVIDGVEKPLPEWAEEYHLKPTLVSQRIHVLGWSAMKALSTPAVMGQKTKIQTHCHRGHELTDSNVYRFRNGKRECRTCKLARLREANRKVTNSRSDK